MKRRLGEAGFRSGGKTMEKIPHFLRRDPLVYNLKNAILYMVRYRQESAENQLPPEAKLLNPAASSGQVPAKRLRTSRPGIWTSPDGREGSRRCHP